MIKKLLIVGMLSTFMLSAVWAKPTPTPTRGRVFGDRQPTQLTSRSGIASWYSYRNRKLITASVHYPCGTKIKVTNPATGKSIVVTVEDWGPHPRLHRALDLNKTAFSKIANLSSGVVKVRYTVLHVAKKCRMHRH